MSRASAKTAASKKKQHAGEAPQPAQLEAVRRLSENGRDDEARKRVAELLARFPSFKPLLGLAWHVEWNAGASLAACARAWDWAEASPGSRAALEALFESAHRAGLVALAAAALKRLAPLDGNLFTEPAPEPTPFGDLSLDQAAHIDLGRAFLSAERYGAAIETLSGIAHPAARNNLALAMHSKGDIDAALAAFEDSWQREPRNLFALDWVVRLRLWRHGPAAAAQLLQAVRRSQALRPEDAYGQLSALLLLAADADADAAWKAAQAAQFWDSESASASALDLRPRFDYLGGVAALRLGRNDEADRRFRRACDGKRSHPPALRARLRLAARDPGGIDPEVGDIGNWFPQSWLRALQRMGPESPLIEAFLGRCDARADYLGLAMELGGEGPRLMALEILKLRARGGDAVAIAELKSLLARPCGPDMVRTKLHGWLAEKDFTAEGEVLRLLVNGTVHEVRPLKAKITAEPRSTDYSPEEEALNVAIHEALRGHRLAHALELAERLRAMRPRDPMALAHVATIKDGLGHPAEECDALYREALAIDPAYLFARVGLAKAHARRGELDAAKEIVLSLLGREEYHHSEWRAILGAQIALAEANGDKATARDLKRAIDDIQAQFA